MEKADIHLYHPTNSVADFCYRYHSRRLRCWRLRDWDFIGVEGKKNVVGYYCSPLHQTLKAGEALWSSPAKSGVEPQQKLIVVNFHVRERHLLHAEPGSLTTPVMSLADTHTSK